LELRFHDSATRGLYRLYACSFPQFDCLFLFDHSNGHDWLQPDGLSLSKICKNFGGKQPKMRNSKIVDSSLFGKYHDDSFTLQLNDTQSMVFTSEDHGPFYLSADERERRKYDENTGTQVKKNMSDPN
jgi:hypothetical protein